MSVSAEALGQIKNLLGQGGFVDDAGAIQPYVAPWRGGSVGKAPLVALPNSTLQVAQLVGICAQHRIGMVPQGGNTGLVGGSVPSSSGNEIVINLKRMNKIREIDPIGSVATVEAGVILQVLQEVVAEAGMLFPLSIASEGTAEIGGVISTNAGGTAVLRYGTMRDLVMGIESVLPDGQIYSGLQKLPKNNTGYDIGRYFIGAEGTLGIVTAATVKLFPAPRQNFAAVFAVANAENTLELLKDFRREAAEYLTTFEIMSHAALKLTTQQIPGTRFPGKDDASYYVMVELASASASAPLRDMAEKIAGQALEAGLILDAVFAENEDQRKQFWHLREHIPEALRKHGGGIHFDISLPLDRLAAFLDATAPKIKAVAPDITLMPFGHIGDGNLHYNMYVSAKPEESIFNSLKQKIKTVVYDEVQRHNGSISAEHGIGVERKAELLAYKGSQTIALMKKIKNVFDPHNLMNPGKIFD